jgi:uncharacterized RDD family membrane protein YckC
VNRSRVRSGITGSTGPLTNYTAAPLKRRLISLVYETLILTAVLFAATLPAIMLTRTWEPTTARWALQIWLLILCGCFYVSQWRGAGQTLPMKTWKLRLLTQDGSPLSTKRALTRYAAALLSVALMGLGFLWALIDRDNLFLHDRLAGTRLVMTPG